MAPLSAYSVVVGLVFPLIALLVQMQLRDTLAPLAFVLFYPAVVLSSWLGGRVAGIISIFASVLLARWFFIPPTGSLLPPSVLEILRTLTFIGVGSIIVSAHHHFQRRTEQLAIALEKYRNVTENINDVVWVIDADTLGLLYVSPSVVKQIGYTPEELLAQPPRMLMPPSLLDWLSNWPGGKNGYGERIARDIQVRHKITGPRWAEVIITRVMNPRTGRPEFHGLSRDITERKKTEEYIRHLAQHDALTGLPNRVLFDEHVAATLALARRNGTRFGLMFIDLDKFKTINDTLGHRIGDLLLQGVTMRVLETVRASDAPARIGGDEFVVLLREIRSPDDALVVAEKVRRALCEPFELEGNRVSISASIGIAIYPDHGADPIALACSADTAMYQAKDGGRNQVTMAFASL